MVGPFSKILEQELNCFGRPAAETSVPGVCPQARADSIFWLGHVKLAKLRGQRAPNPVPMSDPVGPSLTLDKAKRS